MTWWALCWGQHSGLWREWGWEVREDILELDRCSGQREWRAQRPRGIGALLCSAVGSMLPGLAGSLVVGRVMRALFARGWVWGALGCEGLCSDTEFMLWGLGSSPQRV